MRALTATTCQAPNSDAVLTGLATYLQRACSMAVELRMDVPWEQRAAALDAGGIDIGWICGMPYVEATDDGTAPYELLVTPVRSAPRYADAPAYFSEVVVRSGSPAETFADLRGTRLGYNEPRSFSGVTALKAYMAERHLETFFGSVVAVGSHERAMQMVQADEIDTAAIDSTVLERQRELAPGSVRGLRVIESIGPNPAPPIVVNRQLGPETIARLRTAAASMHLDPEGQRLLHAASLSRFAVVEDAFYDPIRTAVRLADSVSW